MRKQFRLNGKSFIVNDTTDWDFWDFFGSGQWEPTTIQAADEILKPGDLLFDIGAWVGPLTLWEAKRGVRIVAVEPDPLAHFALEDNIQLNKLGALISIVPKAFVANSNGSVNLRLEGNGGNAYSSITRQEFDNLTTIPVPTVTLEELIKEYGLPTVVKMDIEGGESLVFPEIGYFLRENKIPVLLALHPQWYAKETRDAMDNELRQWKIQDLHNDMYLLIS